MHTLLLFISASLLIHILHAPNFSSFCVHLSLLSSLLAALLFISTLRAGGKKDSNSFYVYTFSFHILFPAFVYSPSPFCSQTAHPLFLSSLCLSFLVIYAHHPAIVIFCLSVFITAASLTVWANPQKSNNAICSYILIYRYSNESIFMRLGGKNLKKRVVRIGPAENEVSWFRTWYRFSVLLLSLVDQSHLKKVLPQLRNE